MPAKKAVSKPPTNAEVTATLGSTASLWRDLRTRIAKGFAPIDEDWVFSGAKHGWALRLKQKKRAVVYLKPCDQYFRASFALGEKAVAAAHEAGLPASVIAVIDSADRYPEGRAVRIDVREIADIDIVERIARVKLDS
jgi:hypothetical protein